MIQLCVGFFVLVLSIICLRVKALKNGKRVKKGKNYTNLFSPNNLKKNDDIILDYFPNNLKCLKSNPLNAIPLNPLIHQI